LVSYRNCKSYIHNCDDPCTFNSTHFNILAFHEGHKIQSKLAKIKVLLNFRLGYILRLLGMFLNFGLFVNPSKRSFKKKF